jgi:hypothetical protein
MGVSARTGVALRVFAVAETFPSVLGVRVLFPWTVLRWVLLVSGESALATPLSAFNRIERLRVPVLLGLFLLGDGLFWALFVSGTSSLVTPTSAFSCMGRCPLADPPAFFYGVPAWLGIFLML